MKRKELEIVISPDGELTVKVEGVAGEGCLEETAFLEEALGEVIEREKTPEFYQTPVGQYVETKKWGE